MPTPLIRPFAITDIDHALALNNASVPHVNELDRAEVQRLAELAACALVAEIDGELTVKRLKKCHAGWLLQAANPDFGDVLVRENNELHIWGVVTRVLHRP